MSTIPDIYKYGGWRDPKMVVFGDALSDAGRRFAAPASFNFSEIGKFPWEKLYDAEDPEIILDAFLPHVGSVTNGKVWPQWLLIPDELNYATSSASATSTFRSLDPCVGYTGDGEDFPTGTLQEQITAYFYEEEAVFQYPDETSDYTHIIALGGNDIMNAAEAMARYSMGGFGYEDPVPLASVYDTGLTFEPVIEEVVQEYIEGVNRLIDGGVTGRILLASVGSMKALPSLAGTVQGALLDEVTSTLRNVTAEAFASYSQVRILDVYSLYAAIIDEPEIITSKGFSANSTACLEYNFSVDYTAEIMGTQADRSSDCPEECAICKDGESPCQQCITERPSGFVCDDANTRIFWDSVHLTTNFASVLADAIRQCAKDAPDYTTAWVEVLCPDA